MTGDEIKGYKLKGKLRQAVAWPIVVEICFAALVVLFFMFRQDFWWIILIAFGIYTMFFILIITAFRRGFLKDMVRFSADYSQTQHTLLYEMNLPYAMLDESGKVLWMNRCMEELTDRRDIYNKNIAAVFPEIIPGIFPKDRETKSVHFEFGSKSLKADIKNIITKDGTEFVAIYLFDESEIKDYIRKIKDDSFAVALIDIDNYEDVLETVDDLSESYFAGIIDKKLYEYFTKGGGFLRKLEKDRYLAVFRYVDLGKFISDRFSILEKIKEISQGNKNPVTLSIGVCTGAETYARTYETSKSSLELALGRGGDQAVVRDGDHIEYYGGKSQQIESNTRVKARMKAHALGKIFESKKNIVIMGHRMQDIDSFGAAIGMYCFARHLGKDARVVINEITPSVKPFYDRFVAREEYKDILVKSSGALSFTEENTVVVVVDVNKPEMTECPELLEKTGTRVVFDHHRTSESPIKGVVLSYVDTSASSSSEMITEMMQFGSLDLKLKGFEADALYAGIVIDTDNFNTKAGPRTFEAAAYLRRNGADVARVRKLLRTDMDLYRAIAGAVEDALIYRDAFAITAISQDNPRSATEAAAKTANELLDIVGVKASFAITEYEGTAHISARSIDEVNVQIIMEKLGGGGHLGTAGAQLKDCSKDEAIQKLKDVIDSMIKEGEI